jgi:hypothetical protein
LSDAGGLPLNFTSKSFIMPLFTILIVLIVAGLLLWLVNTYIPMDGKIKTIFNIVVVLVVIVWLLKVFGLFTYLTNITV